MTGSCGQCHVTPPGSAPLFCAKERSKLQAFIRKHVRHGDRRKALYAIEHGRIQPSKMLADSVLGLLQGKPEFVLIDEQKCISPIGCCKRST